MSERLAIKTDRIRDFEKNKPKQASTELLPRMARGETAKSSWAYVNASPFSGDFEFDPLKGELLIQAANLYVNLRRFSNDSVTKVKGISPKRNLFPASSVVDDNGDHLCPDFEPTHRSITLTQGQADSLVLLFERDDLGTFMYTKDELRDVLQFLLSRGKIRAELRPTVQEILDEE